MSETLELQSYMTAQELDELEALLTPYDTVSFADLKIRTKGTETTPPALITFRPNDVQTINLDLLHDTYPARVWRNGIYTLRGASEDCLKARQQGFSTQWLALYFLDTINNPLT